MASQKIQVELLLSRRVFGLNNRPIGRVEDIDAELRQGELYVNEFLVGSYALFDRFAALSMGAAILGLFGKLVRKGYAIPWNKLDLSEPSRPRLTCSVKELREPKE